MELAWYEELFIVSVFLAHAVFVYIVVWVLLYLYHSIPNKFKEIEGIKDEIAHLAEEVKLLRDTIREQGKRRE